MACSLVPLAAVTAPDIFLNVLVHVGPVEVGLDLVSHLQLPKVAGDPAIRVLGEDFLAEVSAFWDILAVLEEH
jgi:hypothetical protein